MSDRPHSAFDDQFKAAFETHDFGTPNKHVWANLAVQLAEDRLKSRISFLWPFRLGLMGAFLIYFTITAFNNRERIFSEAMESHWKKLAISNQFDSGNSPDLSVSSAVERRISAPWQPTGFEVFVDRNENHVKDKSIEIKISTSQQIFDTIQSQDQTEPLAIAQLPMPKREAQFTNTEALNLVTEAFWPDLPISESRFAKRKPWKAFFTLGLDYEWYNNFDLTTLKAVYAEQPTPDQTLLPGEGYLLTSTIDRAFSSNASVSLQRNKWMATGGIRYTQLHGSVTTLHDVEEQVVKTEVVEMPVPSPIGGGFETRSFEREAIVSSYVQDTLSTTYRMEMVSVPFSVGYELGRANWRIIPTVGTEHIFLSRFQSRARSANFEEFPETTSNYGTNNSYNLQLTAGVGVTYSISPQLSLLVRPQYRYSVYASDESVINSRFGAFALGTGLRYQIR